VTGIHFLGQTHSLENNGLRPKGSRRVDAATRFMPLTNNPIPPSWFCRAITKPTADFACASDGAQVPRR
jgi:hypothetical protein